MKQTVIGVLAHVDAGKTTLSEAMLFCSGGIRTLGRVDHGLRSFHFGRCESGEHRSPNWGPYATFPSA